MIGAEPGRVGRRVKRERDKARRRALRVQFRVQHGVRLDGGFIDSEVRDRPAREAEGVMLSHRSGGGSERGVEDGMKRQAEESSAPTEI